MPFPETGPATVEAVKAQLSITDADDDGFIAVVVGAVNERVKGWPVAQPANLDPAPADWSAFNAVVLGANMLASRLVRRRNSPDGVSAFAEGGPVYVRRNDPDVAMLLQLGDYAAPQVG